MTNDTEHMIEHLLYRTFSSFPLNSFVLNLGTFLVEYIPIMSIALRRFENKRITTLSYYSFKNLLPPPPKVIELSDELMEALSTHPCMSAYKYTARILPAHEQGPFREIYSKMSRENDSNLSFPLIVDDFLTTSLYISISTKGIGKYNEEHLAFCEKIRAPLAAALTNILRHEASPAEEAGQAEARRWSKNPAAGSASHSRESIPAYPTLNEVIKTHIRKTLDLTQGRVSGPKGAAKLLGVPSSTLSSKIRRLGIPVPREKNG